ncbi:MAG: hypothetical protein M0Q49_11405 [Porticoccaceae bacterium]|nr:hypothetical protein [Porticoccaceae bacterium]
MDIFIGNDNLIVVDGLKNVGSGAFINNATVRGTLKTMAGDPVEGQTWPVTMVYKPESQGVYQGVLEDDLPLTNGTSYIVEVTADAGSDQIAKWEIVVKARNRRIP